MSGQWMCAAHMNVVNIAKASYRESGTSKTKVREAVFCAPVASICVKKTAQECMV